MNTFWNILMRPIIEELNARYIVEVGLDTGLNTHNILKYCADNNAHLTTIAPFPSLYLEDYKTEFRDKFEIYLEDNLKSLPQLKDYDVIVLEVENDYKTLLKELKIIESSFSKKLPMIFLLDLGVYFSQNPEKRELTHSKASDNEYSNINHYNDLLTTLENFIEESKLELSYNIVDSNELGILYPQNNEIEDIINNYLDNFNLVRNLENKNWLLNEDIKEYKNELRYLENRLNWVSNKNDYKNNKNRSYLQRLISKFPMLYMIPRMVKIGTNNTLINRKGFYAIKKYNLLDIGYYLTRNPDVKLTGQDPIIHYIYHGFRDGRTPNPEFDGEYYLETHPQVKESKINPLVHYALYGIKDRINSGEECTGLKMFGSGKIRGEIRFNKSKMAVEGFYIDSEEISQREVILKIDNKNFKVKYDTKDVNPNENVQENYYYFKFNVPLQFIDNKAHTVQLYDKQTRIVIDNKRMVFPQTRAFNDFSGFLASSIVSPVINAPFREQDKRCFATMENVAKYLTEQALKKDKPLVSVIMPVYNRIDIVEDAVGSVLNQSYPNIELIIVDDGSDDGSKELLESIEDDRIVLLHNEKSKGVSVARNKGLETARGKYITYLDSDNIWDSRYVAAMVGAFSELPDADALYSGQLLYNANDSEPFAVRFGTFNRSLLSNRNYIDLNAFCHTNEVYKKVGGFDETLNRLVDYDLIMRMAETSQIYSIPVLLSYYYYDNAVNTITNTSGFTELLETVRNKRKKRIEKRNQERVVDLKSNHSPIHNVSVIIPSFEALEDITECIDSLLSLNATNWMEIIVVDNKSSKPVLNYLNHLEADKKIKFIENDINYGFTYAVNQGIDAAEKVNDIVILNNDALITTGAIESLQRAAYELPDCGIAVPQQVLPGGTKTITTHVPHAYPQYECDVNLSAAHENIINVPIFHSGRIVELNFAPFFCVYIKREVIDSSVGLDAEYGRHYRSDRIFCNFIRHLMNLKIYYIEEAKVYHKLQKSTVVLSNKQKRSSDFDLMFKKNQWDPELADKLGYKAPPWDF